MKRLLMPVCTVLLALCLSAVAQPFGTFSYTSLGGPTSAQAVWDITGTYTISLPVEGLGQLSLDLPIVQDARGKLTGPGTILMTAGTNELICTAKVQGRTAGPSQDFVATISVKLAGTGELLGEVRKFKGSLVLKLKLDPNTAHLVGSLTGNASLSGAGSGSTQVPMAFPLPPEMAGSWSMTLNLQPSGTKLAGDATVTLSNGRTLPFAVNGSFSTKDGRGSLKLGGVEAAQGAKLGINTKGSPPALDRVSGRLLGVTLN